MIISYTFNNKQKQKVYWLELILKVFYFLHFFLFLTFNFLFLLYWNKKNVSIEKIIEEKLNISDGQVKDVFDLAILVKLLLRKFNMMKNSWIKFFFNFWLFIQPISILYGHKNPILSDSVTYSYREINCKQRYLEQ